MYMYILFFVEMVIVFDIFDEVKVIRVFVEGCLLFLIVIKFVLYSLILIILKVNFDLE